MSTIGECNGNKVKHRLQPPWAAPPTSDKLSSMIRGTRPSDLVKALDDDEMVPSLGTEHAIFSVVLACDRRDVADAFFMKAVAECRGPLVAPLPAGAPFLRPVVPGAWPVAIRASTIPASTAQDFEALLASGPEV